MNIIQSFLLFIEDQIEVINFAAQLYRDKKRLERLTGRKWTTNQVQIEQQPKIARPKFYYASENPGEKRTP